jgi:hypothetical protein
MPVLSVSLDGGSSTMRTVQLRTAKLAPGVLCEVMENERLLLCEVLRVNRDGSFTARRLPEPPSTKPSRPRPEFP